MQDLYERMTTLQHQSPASSYAETECTDSDIDSNDCHDAKRKFLARDAQRIWVRTAPISIPSRDHQQLHSYRCESLFESTDLSYHADMRLLHAGRCHYADEDDDDELPEAELEEDDSALFGNLAFFRSQYGVSQTCMVKRNACTYKSIAAPASPTGVDDRDEDIFAMEL
ncbi:unnamed protein product [Peronospora farinosa]|uniref:Uncharacterized protein n=1 Tax=Peronospora farinosa TaxID=134698 RepID=A0AAV0U9Q6_9STRA|nr:unnamed protein product [Peronospora farinosa]CAI5733757.1 unnamed protein product [Peronospora farinosa]